MGDVENNEEEEKVADDVGAEDEEILIYMPVVLTFSDYETCTDQHPEDKCRECTWDCPCRPRPSPIPVCLSKPKNPSICLRCKEKIVTPTKYVWPKATPFRYTVFGDMHYHRRCFRCKLCDRSIFVEVMIKENENVFCYGADIVCSHCHHKLHSQWCNNCGEPIRFGRVACEDKEYHLDCLVCSSCGINIAHHKRSSHHLNKPYCANCLTNMTAKKCTECKFLIPNGCLSFFFRGKKYHFGCFRCALCLDPLICPGGPDKPVMVMGSTKLCVDCVPKHCSNCGEKLARGPGTYEMDENGVIKCLECTHIGYNRKLEGKPKRVIPPPVQKGTGIGDISYPDSESEEEQEDEDDRGGGPRRSFKGRKGKKKKQFSTWGAKQKPEPPPPKRLSNDLKVTEELYTIYMWHTSDGVIVTPAHGEEGVDEG